MTMKILIIPGLTLPEVSDEDLVRIRAAAGADAEVLVTGMKAAHDEVADADVVLGLVPESLFARARQLRWVHAIASGVDMFLYPEFRDSEIVLTSEKGLVGPHLADHGFGLLLMLTRQLATAQRHGADAWNHRPEMRRQEIELTGLTLGCVGYGGTGKAMTRRGAAFGMGCRAIDPQPVEPTEEVPVVEGVDGFNSLLEESDVVAVCCPLTPATRDLFDASAFARMKPTAYLVNVTRGEVMQEQALVDALSEGTIRGAALDVAPREPLPADSRLWQLDNVVMTPHTAGASQFRASRNLDRFISNLAALREDGALEGVIDKQLGY
jgi:phosphoglycerate dehydrogenase-like enzyme